VTRPVRKYHPEYLFLAACVAVVAATLYDVVLQYSAVPAVMRYVPPESSAYAFTPSLRSLWVASDPHVGRFFRAVLPPKGKSKGEDVGVATRLAQDIRETLRKSGIPLAQVDDLIPLGIDPDRAAAAAMVKGSAGPGLLFAVPILGEQGFLDAAGKLFEEKAAPASESLSVGGREYAVHKRGDWFIVFPGASTAILARDKGLFPRALLDSEGNLAYFRSGDHAIRSFAQLMPGYEARPEAWIKGSADLGPFARSLRFAVAIDGERMLIRTKIMPPVGQSRHLQKVVARGDAELASLIPSMSQGNLSAVLVDSSFSSYFGLLERQMGGSRKSPLEEYFPGVMEELEKANQATRLSLAVGPEPKAVPDVLLGLELGQAEAEDLVFRVQSKLRLKRDAQILEAALKQREKDTGAAQDLSPAALVAEKRLSAERDALWPRYRRVQGAFKSDPPLARPDFANSSYQREEGGRALRFILPPMSDDDFRYRLSEDERKDASEAELKADKYRLCSIYSQGTLWFGNDADGLRRWLDRLQSSRVNADLEDASRVAGHSLRSKLTLFIHPRQLLDQGALHPDPRVNTSARRDLSELDGYRVVLLTVAADPTEQELYAAITLLR